MTTTDRTPDEIHQLGLSEVARIRAEMDEVVRRSGFKGDRKAFVERLRTDPALYPKTPEELMAYAAVLAKRIDGEMPRLFGRLPRLPYTVKEVPAATAAGTTTAYYEPGSPETGRAGVYRVNTSKLDQRPLFEMPALTVHEAVPGHHQQIAIQQELDLPMFRKYAVNFTAFSEGWGLYSERLGIEMGLYDTPEKDFGRLSYEMWRACRLVVDTGLHAKGWTREQAIQFMLDNTALSRGNIEAEVNRYMVGPGQALAYKLGELKIRDLRGRAEKALGPDFDLRAFHDAVLENGEVPLDVLEAQVSAWIETAEGGCRPRRYDGSPWQLVELESRRTGLWCSCSSLVSQASPSRQPLIGQSRRPRVAFARRGPGERSADGAAIHGSTVNRSSSTSFCPEARVQPPTSLPARQNRLRRPDKR